MDIVYSLVVAAHLICWALVLGLSVAGMMKSQVFKGTMHSALGALVTGILIVGMREMMDMDVNHMKIGMKLLVAAVVTVLAVMAERKRGGEKMLGPIVAATVVNVLVAVIW